MRYQFRKLIDVDKVERSLDDLGSVLCLYGDAVRINTNPYDGALFSLKWPWVLYLDQIAYYKLSCSDGRFRGVIVSLV
jgi:hypothetical protein